LRRSIFSSKRLPRDSESPSVPIRLSLTTSQQGDWWRHLGLCQMVCRCTCCIPKSAPRIRNSWPSEIGCSKRDTHHNSHRDAIGQKGPAAKWPHLLWPQAAGRATGLRALNGLADCSLRSGADVVISGILFGGEHLPDAAQSDVVSEDAKPGHRAAADTGDL
jgi:hypothetical protein